MEFALVLPLLLALVFGAVQFGRVLNYWNDANQLAGDGARFAAVDRNPGAASSKTLQQWIAGQFDTAEARKCMSVTISYATGAKVGDPVTVQVERPWRFMPLLGLATVPLKGTAVMRLEHLPSTYGAGTYTTSVLDRSCP